MHRPLTCRVVVRGALPADWTDWFTGLVASPTSDGDTALVGELPDQAALHGVTTRIRDLGLDLVSLTTDVSTTDVSTTDIHAVQE
jgi:hypothetical protein